MSWLSSALNVVGSIAGIFGGIQQNQAMESMYKQNYQLAHDQLYSAHQIEVNDLKAAGLNPILSANKGNSTFNPGSYQPVNKYQAAVQLAQQIADTKLAEANSSKAVSEARQADANARLMDRQTQLQDTIQAKLVAETDNMVAQTKVYGATEQKIMADYKYRMKELETYDARWKAEYELTVARIAAAVAQGQMSIAQAQYWNDRVLNNAVERGLIMQETKNKIEEGSGLIIKNAKDNIELQHLNADATYTSPGWQTTRGVFDTINPLAAIGRLFGG